MQGGSSQQDLPRRGGQDTELCWDSHLKHLSMCWSLQKAPFPNNCAAQPPHQMSFHRVGRFIDRNVCVDGVQWCLWLTEQVQVSSWCMHPCCKVIWGSTVALWGLQPQTYSQTPCISGFILIPSNNPREIIILLSTETSTGKSICCFLKHRTHLSLAPSILCQCWSSSSNCLCLLCSQTGVSLVVTHTSNTLAYYMSSEKCGGFCEVMPEGPSVPFLSHTAPSLAATAPSGSCQEPLTPPLSIPVPSGSLKHQHEGMQHPVYAAPSCGCRSALAQPSQGTPGPSQPGIPKIHEEHESIAPLLLVLIYSCKWLLDSELTTGRWQGEKGLYKFISLGKINN